jgi:hypothetical protein
MIKEFYFCEKQFQAFLKWVFFLFGINSICEKCRISLWNTCVFDMNKVSDLLIIGKNSLILLKVCAPLQAE